MSDALNDRRKELEEGFFAQQNAKLVEKLRAEKQNALTLEGLTQATGITSQPVLDALLKLKLDATTVAALALFPLVQVAWADGTVDEKEKKAVLDAAAKSGVQAGSPALGLLESWLKSAPPAALESTWAGYVQALTAKLSAGDKALLKNELLGRARTVAEASGGILGMGNKVSANEDKVLARLAAIFG